MSSSLAILLVGVALVALLIAVTIWVWYPRPPAWRDDRRDDRPDPGWEGWRRKRDGIDRDGIDRDGMDGGGLAARLKDGGGGQ